MGRRFLGRSSFDRVIDNTSEISGQSVRNFITVMSDKDLCRTDRVQLAIFAMSMGIVALLDDEGIRPDVMSGHSLGHFSALTIAGAITLEDATRLVNMRGKIMLSVGERHSGGMGVVQGISVADVRKILTEAKVQVWPANLNLPKQVVVSGVLEDMESARSALMAAGGKWMSLNVSGAFHTSLLNKEMHSFAEKIAETPLRVPSCPIFSNINGQLLDDVAMLRKDLSAHMTAPVDWCSVMARLIAKCPDVIIEIGSSKVLTGMMMHYHTLLCPLSTGSPLHLDRVIEVCRENQDGSKRRSVM